MILSAVIFNLVLMPLDVNAAVVVDHSFFVEAGTRYHDNLNFVESDRESIFLHTVIPQYELSAEDGINKWTGLIGFTLQRSSNTDVFDHRRDPNASIGWSRQLENGLFEINAQYSQFSSRITQFSDTGRAVNDSTNIDKNLAAVWERSLTNRLLFRLNGEYAKTKFEDETSLTDFNNRMAGVGLEYKINEKVTPFVLFRENRFSTTAQPTIDYREYQAGAIYTISPSFIITAGAGITKLESGQRESTGALGIIYERPRSQTAVDFSRAFLPTGIGGLQFSNIFEVSHMYALSQKSRVNLALVTNDTNDEINVFNSQSITGRYAYDIDARWVLGMDIIYQNIKQQATPSVSNTSVGLTFIYTPFQR